VRSSQLLRASPEWSMSGAPRTPAATSGRDLPQRIFLARCSANLTARASLLSRAARALVSASSIARAAAGDAVAGRDAVRGFTRVGVVLDPEYAAADGTLKALPSAARELGLEARVYEVRSGAELEARFAAAARDGMQALYVPEAPLFLTRRSEIAAAAASVRLPAIYTFREFVQAGGLMSYGADLPALYQRAAGYVDKILKGAKPGELPLQSAEKFELAVNLKTAKALNLTIAEAFLLRADEVIE
jgi:ABC-type uncharacterized transport system substrate-binding protein